MTKCAGEPVILWLLRFTVQGLPALPTQSTVSSEAKVRSEVMFNVWPGLQVYAVAASAPGTAPRNDARIRYPKRRNRIWHLLLNSMLCNVMLIPTNLSI